MQQYQVYLPPQLHVGITAWQYQPMEKEKLDFNFNFYELYTRVVLKVTYIS